VGNRWLYEHTFASVVPMVTETFSRPSAPAHPAAAPPSLEASLGLLALAIDVCADEVARLLSRPTPTGRRPGPVVRFVGPGVGQRAGFAPARNTS